MQKPTIPAPTIPIGLRQRAGKKRRRGTASQAATAVASLFYLVPATTAFMAEADKYFFGEGAQLPPDYVPAKAK